MQSTAMRTCPTCGEEKTLTAESFHRQLSGYAAACKACANCAAAAYRNQTGVEVLRERVQRSIWSRRAVEYGVASIEEAKVEHTRRKEKRWADAEALAANQLVREAEQLAFGQAVAERLEQAMQSILAEDRRVKKRQTRQRERASLKRRDPQRYSELNRARKHRYEARKREAEGEFTAQDIGRLWENQQGRCYYCHTKLQRQGDARTRFHIDHYVPLALSGRNSRDNLVLSCPMCNSIKSAQKPEVFLAGLGRLL